MEGPPDRKPDGEQQNAQRSGKAEPEATSGATELRSKPGRRHSAPPPKGDGPVAGRGGRRWQARGEPASEVASGTTRSHSTPGRRHSAAPPKGDGPRRNGRNAARRSRPPAAARPERSFPARRKPRAPKLASRKGDGARRGPPLASSPVPRAGWPGLSPEVEAHPGERGAPGLDLPLEPARRSGSTEGGELRRPGPGPPPGRSKCPPAEWAGGRVSSPPSSARAAGTAFASAAPRPSFPRFRFPERGVSSMQPSSSPARRREECRGHD